jgi:DNA-binding transcriptional LysR family regulator
MAVEASQIANLLAIARHGSFTQAAIEKGMSQPALSNSIALLERRLGVRVLERTRRGSTLTPCGEILVRRAEGVRSLLDDAEAEVRSHVAGVAGPLRIGATPSVLINLVPHAFRLMDQTGPMYIEVVDGLDDVLVPMLRTGALDLIVGPVEELFGSSADVQEVTLLDDPFSVAVGPSSSFFDRTSLKLADLAEAPWVLPRLGSAYRRHVEALFMIEGVPWPRDCILANSIPVIESFVASTARVTLVSAVQLSGKSGGFRVIPLARAGGRKIGYKVRTGSRPSALGASFLDALGRASMQLTATENTGGSKPLGRENLDRTMGAAGSKTEF